MLPATPCIFRRAVLAGAVLTFALSLLTGCAQTQPRVERYGMMIGVRPDKVEYYRQLHANAWPGVLSKLEECNIQNYSIYLGQVNEQNYLLFGYLEYTGQNFAADMAKMASDPTTQKWWRETEPCQIPLPARAEGEWWSGMEEVFHTN